MQNGGEDFVNCLNLFSREPNHFHRICDSLKVSSIIYSRLCKMNLKLDKPFYAQHKPQASKSYITDNMVLLWIVGHSSEFIDFPSPPIPTEFFKQNQFNDRIHGTDHGASNLKWNRFNADGYWIVNADSGLKGLSPCCMTNYNCNSLTISIRVHAWKCSQGCVNCKKHPRHISTNTLSQKLSEMFKRSHNLMV